MPAFLAAAVISGFISGSLAAGALAFSFTAFATAAIIGGLSMALAKKPAQPGESAAGTSAFSSQGRNLTITQPVSPWQIVLGEVRTGGVLTFAYLDSAKAYFHLVITLACHEVDGMEELILNGEVIGPDKIDAGGNVVDGNWGGYGFPAVAETFAVPGSPYQVTVAHDVWTVQSVSIDISFVDSDGNTQPGTAAITEVSGTPGDGQYARSGNTFTFALEQEAKQATINYTWRQSDSKCRVKFASGAETGQPFPDLVAESEGRWTDAHRQTGHAKLYLRFPTSAIIGGVPQASVVLLGMKPYDPRTGLAAFSANPALLLGEYMTDAEFGFGADADSDIDADTQEAAANLCEERVLATDDGVLFTADAATDWLTFTGPASGGAALDLNAASGVPVRTPRSGDGVRLTTTGTLPAGLSLATTYYVIRVAAGLVKLATSYAAAMARNSAVNITDAGAGVHTLTLYDEPRYTANGTFLTSQARAELVSLLIGAMAGRMAPVGDSWFMHAGAYDSPTVTLDENEIIGPVRIDPVPETQDAANGVRGVFVDTASNYTATDFPAVTDDAYLEADGDERLWADLDFTGLVTSGPTAQRLAKIELRRRRYAMTFTATFRLSAWRALTARTVALNFAKYGWTEQEFEVTRSRFMVITEGEGPTLGVELTLRQSDSAIWDWSLSEQEVQAAVKNTSLTSPFDMAEPGVPAVTEELYETSGSAGVKTRALLAWSPGDGQTVQNYDLRYKRVEDATYTQPASIPGLSPAAQVDDLAAGLYLFGIRAVNNFGVASAWVTVIKELVGLTAPPAGIDNFAVQSLASQAKMTWSKPADLDVIIGGRVIVRWSPKVTGASWEHGSLVNPDGYPGDTSIGFGPLMTGTYMAKARDSSGNFSVTEASFVVTEALITGLSTLVTVTESPGFSGAKTNVAVVDSGLQLDTADAIDSITALMDSWGYIDSQGGLSGTGSYAFASKMDLGSVKQVRLFTNMDSLAFDADDLWDSRTDLIDNWGPVDGAVIDDAEAQLMVRATNDDPAGAATWRPWHALGLVGDYSARGFDFRLDYATASATHNRKVTTLAVAAKQ